MERGIFFILIFSIFMGCSMDIGAKKQENFLGGVWTLQAIQKSSIRSESMGNIHLELQPQNKKFFGTDGCNNIFGNLKSLNKEELIFDSIASTRMACENMKAAHNYTSLLKKVGFYNLKNGTLTLLDKDKNTLLEYKKESKE